MPDEGSDPVRIVAALRGRDVSFVLTGGLAAAARGSGVTTADVEVCVADDEANLLRLNEHFGFGFLDDLVEEKKTAEQASAELDWEFHSGRLAELEGQLDRAFEKSGLPEDRDRAAVNELLVRVQLGL